MLGSLRQPLQKGFTLVELLVVIAIIGTLSIILFLALNPAELIEKSRVAKTEENLVNMAKAANLDVLTSGSYAADVARNVAPSFVGQMTPPVWPAGTFPSSNYDWDNWIGETCWDGTTNNVQITLRDINDYQGEADYTIYYVLQGPGVPHCDDSDIEGICVNCPDRYP